MTEILFADEVIVIGPRDRAAFVGRTKSGKTTLSSALLTQIPFVVSIDPKGTFFLPGGRITTTPADFKRQQPIAFQPQIYRPMKGYWTIDAYDEVFEAVYERQNTTVHVTEVYGVCKGPQVPENYLACITRGAELNIRVMSESQRPANIPQVILSETDHSIMFELLKLDDRKRMTESMGDGVLAPLTEPHSFYYYQTGGDPVAVYKLNLEGNR